MTYVENSRRILCDGFNCESVITNLISGSIERYAMFRGWLIAGQRHYCPKCKTIITKPKT